MKTIHIKGFADEIDLKESFSDNYDLHVRFGFNESSVEVIEDVFLRFYESNDICSLDEAIEGELKMMYGSLDLEGQDYGYSEYTIEGFEVNSLKLGGHDLESILKSKGHKYLHILIDKIDKK